MSDEALMISEVLKGLTGGLMTGMEMRRQKEKDASDAAYKRESLDIEWQKLAEKNRAEGAPSAKEQFEMKEKWGGEYDPNTKQYKKTSMGLEGEKEERFRAEAERRNKQYNRQEEAFFVKGFGSERANSPQAATKLKEEVASAHTARYNIDEIVTAGKEMQAGQKILPARFNELKSSILANRVSLKAAIRIPVTGGGNISEGEQRMLDEIVADPSNLLRYGKAAIVALEKLKQNIAYSAVIKGSLSDIKFTDQQLKKLGLSDHSIKYFRSATGDDLDKIDKIGSGLVAQPLGNTQSEIERIDKKTGKKAIFDSNTKKFLRWGE